MLEDKPLYQRAKDFLFGKDFLILLFFLALSFTFWFILTINQSYEKELPVVVHLSGVPQNVVVTTNISDTVYVTVRDKGFMLLPYYTANKLRPISLPFATYTGSKKGHGQVPLADLRRLVAKQLFSSTQIVSLKADNLDFYYNYGRKKEVRVALQGNVVPGGNYYLSHTRLDPEKVVVYADDKTLDSITTVQTVYINLTNFTDTVTRTVALKAVKGVKMVPGQVRVTFYPDVLTDESVDVPVTTINKPDGVVVRTFPQRVKVYFTVGASMFRMLNLDEFKVVVDYSELAKQRSDKCTLHLAGKPAGVNNVKLELQQVDYLIEQ